MEIDVIELMAGILNGLLPALCQSALHGHDIAGELALWLFFSMSGEGLLLQGIKVQTVG